MGVFSSHEFTWVRIQVFDLINTWVKYKSSKIVLKQSTEVQFL